MTEKLDVNTSSFMGTVEAAKPTMREKYPLHYRMIDEKENVRLLKQFGEWFIDSGLIEPFDRDNAKAADSYVLRFLGIDEDKLMQERLAILEELDATAAGRP
jgi:hypothetical protein